MIKSFTIHELNIKDHISELQRTQFPTVSARSARNPELTVYVLTRNCRTFLYGENSTLLGYTVVLDFFSTLYEANKCFDHMALFYQDPVMFIEPITRKTFKCSTPLSYVKNPQNGTALDPDIDEQCVFIPKPVLRVTPTGL